MNVFYVVQIWLGEPHQWQDEKVMENGYSTQSEAVARAVELSENMLVRVIERVEKTVWDQQVL